MIRSISPKICSVLKTLKGLALDGLFPIRCIGCGAYDEWLCKKCHTILPIITEQKCPLCKKNVTSYGENCFSCVSNTIGFDGVFVVSHYHDRIVKSAIHYFKYRFVRELKWPLALLTAQSLQNSHFPTPDMIIPIPLHARRLRWRGFNQSEELANALDLRIPLITDILVRVRYTKPQTRTKDRNDRLRNLHNAFDVISHNKIKNKNILLIDDVMTTGATLTECAIALKDAGAKNVHCLVLARE